ncbi:hypothetical protein FRC12_014307 [Ceratobasidium sp. 428]|nr:hypothetical protein FRC12_014307 [Ceratobasidium sp. 428]
MPTVEECLELLEKATAQRTSEQQDEQLDRFKTYEYEQALLRIAVMQSSQAFEQSRKLEDLDVIITCVARALQLLPEDHPNRPIWLDKLATSYLSRFDLAFDVEDLDKALSKAQEAVSLTPDNHIDKAGYLNNLGLIQQSRFQSPGDLESMKLAMKSMENAVSVTPDDSPDKPLYLKNLSTGYRRLFEHLGEQEHIEKAITFAENAISLISHGHPDLPEYLNTLADHHRLAFERLGRLESLNRSINLKEQALALTPEDHPLTSKRLDSLGTVYRLQFERIGKLEDLDQAIQYMESAVALTPDDHDDLASRLSNLGASNQLLFDRLGRLGDLQKAINCLQQAAFLTPDQHNDKHIWLNNLGISYSALFELLGRSEDIEQAVSCKERAVLLIADGHKDKPSWLSNLGTSYWTLFKHLGRPEDIYKSIYCQEKAISLGPKGHQDWPLWQANLGISLATLFESLGKLEHLDKAINCLEEAVVLTPDEHSEKPSRLRNLGRLYYVKFDRLHTPRDLSRAILLLRQATVMPIGDPSVKLRAARAWSLLSLINNDVESQVEAYVHVMQILPQVVWLGVSVNHRYKSLTNIEFHALGMEAATVAIRAQRYDLALEWLEQGRSIVWGQTLQLRAPFEELDAVDPMLVEQLRQVSNELERLSTDRPTGQAPGQESAMDHRHRRLAETRERLLEEIRHLPALDDFLRPKASKLVSMVQDGVVVIVNVHFSRCDALVLRAGEENVTHVPLPNFSSRKAATASNQLKPCLYSQGVRRGFKSCKSSSTHTIRGILSMLWYDVAKPILDHLGITQPLPVEDLPHITWCTTGPLSFLPLHAAGDYASFNTTLPNLVISSYIPTLSALRQTASSPNTFSGILAVGHESSIRGLDPLPGTKAELDEIQAQATSIPFTRLDERAATGDDVLTAMQNHSWVHFACHASQNLDDPMRSALHLHDRDLDLATITGSQLNNAQLAFLSACQTATGDAALPDEAVHLAAGLLFAGYRSVIATMWSIQDQDAPLIAGKVYETLLEGEAPDHWKAARALHQAVANLRDKVGVNAFERWAPYVHIGQ